MDAIEALKMEMTDEPMSLKLLNASEMMAILPAVNPTRNFPEKSKKLHIIPIRPAMTLYCSRTFLSVTLS